MQTLPSLPFELFEEILRLAIDVHPARHAIPRVNSTWANVSLPILHSRISFTSGQQLRLFSAAPGELCCDPREVDVILPSGTEESGVLIYKALTKCQRNTMSPSESCYRGITVLRLSLNTHLTDNDVKMIGSALCQVNPEVFVWTGPDPKLYFSIAIPTAVKLCEAISKWSSLRRLELWNVAFLNYGHELSRALTKMCNCSPFPFNPPHTNGVGPIQIVINQAVFMRPISVLQIALGVPALRELRLIDVYQHSIWGPRMCMDDVEGLLLTSDSEHISCHASKDDCLERLREVVSCVVNTIVWKDSEKL